VPVEALRLTAAWPVPHVAAAVVLPDDSVSTIGDVDLPFRLASITKVLSSWAMLIAVEEGIVSLDQPAGQPGCTLRHLLAHAGGYPFDGVEPISPPARRRIYSNRGNARLIVDGFQVVQPGVGMVDVKEPVVFQQRVMNGLGLGLKSGFAFGPAGDGGDGVKKIQVGGAVLPGLSGGAA
jgi:hypothetical protein